MHAPDTIVIKDLEVYYHVGVPDEERANAQRLLVTLEMETDFGPAVRSDELAQTIDYHAVSQRLLKFGEGRRWRLIETLAEEVAQMVFAEFGARRVGVEIRKFIIPQARYVAVEISRNRP